MLFWAGESCTLPANDKAFNSKLVREIFTMFATEWGLKNFEKLTLFGRKTRFLEGVNLYFPYLAYFKQISRLNTGNADRLAALSVFPCADG